MWGYQEPANPGMVLGNGKDCDRVRGPKTQSDNCGPCDTSLMGADWKGQVRRGEEGK